jgi:hypothetical protein
MDGRLGFHGFGGFQKDTSDSKRAFGNWIFLVWFSKEKKLTDTRNWILGSGFSRIGYNVLFGRFLVFGYWCSSDTGYWMFAYQSTSDTKVAAAALLHNCRIAKLLLLVFTKPENIYANIHQKGVS